MTNAARVIKLLTFLTITFFCTNAYGLGDPRPVHIGYVYPAGGQRGTVVQIRVGGQYLRGATAIHFSGEGISAEIVARTRNIRELQGDQRKLLRKMLIQAERNELAKIDRKAGNKTRQPNRKQPEKKSDEAEVKLPNDPMIESLEKMNLRELAHFSSVAFPSFAKKQKNRQLAECLVLDVVIDANAKPGKYEMRIQSRTGISNPVAFEVSTLPEVYEMEPNNTQAIAATYKGRKLPGKKPLELPAVLNGQILPGDIDRFAFTAKKGQKIVVEAKARSLIPYLADAVPGWFQATVAIYDSKGKEVAFADDFRFNPDPVLFYEIEKNGRYELEIRDSIYRGRDDFIYRIYAGELPFITSMYPLGGEAGKPAKVSIDGVNLKAKTLELNMNKGSDLIRHIRYEDGANISNYMPYAANNMPQCDEADSNNSMKNAQLIDMPKVVNGRIETAGDVDVFMFRAKAGDKLAVEVYGRRLNSPLDSLIRVTDTAGKVLAMNDDHIVKDKHLHKDISGLTTHHADSYLIADIPNDGFYYVHISDTQNQGSPAHAYRLRISKPQPDFDLRMTPSNLYIRTGDSVPVRVDVLRKDGFDGEIEILLEDGPKDFTLNGNTIPKGADSVTMTVSAKTAAKEPLALKFIGQYEIDNEIITRPVVPADNVMQAFLYRHLVPCQEMAVVVKKQWHQFTGIRLDSNTPIKIIPGKSTKVRFKAPKGRRFNVVKLDVHHGPKGITIENINTENGLLEFTIKADKDTLEKDFKDNMILEATAESSPKAKKGQPKPKKKQYSAGALPAIPIQIVGVI